MYVIVLYLNFPDSFIRLEGDVRYGGVDHEREQVEDEVGVTAQAQKCRVTLFSGKLNEEKSCGNVFTKN